MGMEQVIDANVAWKDIDGELFISKDDLTRELDRLGYTEFGKFMARVRPAITFPVIRPEDPNSL